MNNDHLRSNFYIQTGKPRPNKHAVAHVRSIGSAIFDTFEMHTEDACLVWDRIFVPLSYRYDLSVIINDILCIIKNLRKADSGAFHTYFPSDTFHCGWRFTWSGDDLRIEAIWDSLSGNLHDHDVLSAEIQVSRSCFIGEWVELLRVVRDGVRYCGFDASVTEPLDSLLSECEGKYPRGLLYQDSPEDLNPSNA